MTRETTTEAPVGAPDSLSGLVRQTFLLSTVAVVVLGLVVGMIRHVLGWPMLALVITASVGAIAIGHVAARRGLRTWLAAFGGVIVGSILLGVSFAFTPGGPDLITATVSGAAGGAMVGGPLLLIGPLTYGLFRSDPARRSSRLAVAIVATVMAALAGISSIMGLFMGVAVVGPDLLHPRGLFAGLGLAVAVVVAVGFTLGMLIIGVFFRRVAAGRWIGFGSMAPIAILWATMILSTAATYAGGPSLEWSGRARFEVAQPPLTRDYVVRCSSPDGAPGRVGTIDDPVDADGVRRDRISLELQVFGPHWSPNNRVDTLFSLFTEANDLSLIASTIEAWSGEVMYRYAYDSASRSLGDPREFVFVFSWDCTKPRSGRAS